MARHRTTPTKHRGVHSYANADGKTRYLVRARDIDGRSVDREGFERLADALGYQAQVREARASGRGVITPAKAKATRLSQLWPHYWTLRQSTVRKGTATQNERHWRLYSEPQFGHLPLSRLTPRTIQQWVADLSEKVGPKMVIAATGTLRAILDLGVRDQLIPSNPCVSVKLPKAPKRKEARRYLSIDEVEAVARHLSGQQRVAFLTMVFVGLRWGEMASLRVRDLDLDRGRLHVNTSVSYLPNDAGGWEWAEDGTKTGQTRTSAFPASLAPLLREQAEGKRAGDLLFPSDNGGHWRQPAKRSGNHRTAWPERALTAAGVEYLSPNELRHTCASLLVQSGANVKVAAAQLGHSPTMLLQVYADLYDSDLDDIARKMDAAFPHFSSENRGI